MSNLELTFSGLLIGLALFINATKNAVEAWAIQDLYFTATPKVDDRRAWRVTAIFGAVTLLYLITASVIQAFAPRHVGEFFKTLHSVIIVSLWVCWCLWMGVVYNLHKRRRLPECAPIDHKIVVAKANMEILLLGIPFVTSMAAFSRSNDQELASVGRGLILGGVTGLIWSYFAAKRLGRLYAEKYPKPTEAAAGQAGQGSSPSGQDGGTS